MNRKRTPWTVPVTSSCGVRKNCSTVRLPVLSVAGTNLAPTAVSLGRSPWRAASRTPLASRVVVELMVLSSGGRSGGVGVGGVVDRLTGQGEEDLVEGRAAQADVVDGDLSVVEQADDRRQLVGAAVDRCRDAVGVLIG